MLNELTNLLAEMTTSEGPNPTYLDEVTLFKTSKDWPKTGLIYDQCLCFAVQGRKTCHLSDRVFTYGPDHYLVVPSVVPVEIEIFVEGDEPLLGITIPIDYSLVQELVDSLGDEAENLRDISASEPGVYLEPVTGDIIEPCIRLLKALKTKGDATILGKHIIREIYYRVLMGENGHILASAAKGKSNYAKISKALRTIHDNYATPIDVPHLAAEANMSTRSFHDHFKAFTSHTPVQYLKRIRLEKARLFIVNEGEQASITAHKVGYESPSQFSREFKRHFGYPPRDAVRHQEMLLS